ncbi:hypothetical protein Hesp01_51490 [Herbidospora sp. NBRC 101105]|nr:hypothetical protein Hesp01_51490 [Herbidospora sp. NBRC 101105]
MIGDHPDDVNRPLGRGGTRLEDQPKPTGLPLGASGSRLRVETHVLVGVKTNDSLSRDTTGNIGVFAPIRWRRPGDMREPTSFDESDV